MKSAAPDDTDLSEPGGKLRLYVDGPLAAGEAIDLAEGQAHYLRHVMRARPGDAIRLFNGSDGEWRAGLAFPGKRAARAVPEIQLRAQDASPDIWLCFAPVKKTPSDYVAQKATELGVSALRPVITRRTIVSRVNIGRMHANALEAAEQSERLDVPACQDPVALTSMLSAWPEDRRLVFCDEGGAPPILQALGRAEPGPWAVLTGPEGGFDEEERAAIRALPQCLAVSLGPRILRADTAALAALAILQAVLAG